MNIQPTTAFAKRIIPCLDIKNNRVVKGVNFEGLKDSGDPVEVAKRYNDEGADEIVFLDIAASIENKKTMVDIIKEAAQEVFVPLCVGGGINNLNDIYKLLHAGCDKISINSSALRNPDLINEAGKEFGVQCIVVAIDVKKQRKENIANDKQSSSNTYEVFSKGGSMNTHKEALAWAKEAAKRGAGEILLTSMDTDGVKEGFDLEITKQISDELDIPIIASGGAGKMEHFKEIFEAGIDGGLAASIFHFKQIEIQHLKQYLKEQGIAVRL